MWYLSWCMTKPTIWLCVSNRDFPRPGSWSKIAPFPIKRWAKTSQNGVYYSQFLSSTFWWKFHENLKKNSSYRSTKICIKMWMKTCFHLHFYANFHKFYEGQLKQQIRYSFILLISILNGGPVLLDFSKFSKFWRFSKFNKPLAPIS